jgi:DNA-binding CsgD family transcriptional regulator
MADRLTQRTGQYSWQDLNEKEQTVLALVVQGIPRERIAEEVGLAKSTIDKMLSNEEGPRSIYQKIGVVNFAQATNWYYNNVPVSPLTSSAQSELSPVLSAAPPSQLYLRVRYASWLYTMLFFAYVLFMFVPLWLSQLLGLQSNWKDWASIYFLSPLAAGLYGLTLCYQLRRQADRRRLRALGTVFAGIVLHAISQAIRAVYTLAWGASYPSPVDYSSVAAYALSLVGLLHLAHTYPHAKVTGKVIAGVLVLLLFGNVFALQMMVRNGQFQPEWRSCQACARFVLSGGERD